MARNVLRKPEVLKKTGWSNSTLYEKIAEGKLSRGTKIDPEGRVVIWFEDEIDELQKFAVAAAGPSGRKPSSGQAA